MLYHSIFHKKFLSLITFFLLLSSLQAEKLPFYFYKRYEGLVNYTVPVVLYLNREGKRLKGYYYYEKSGIPFYLDGSVLEKDDKLILNRFRFDGNTHSGGRILGSFQDVNKIEAEWNPKGSSKKFPVSLYETYASETSSFSIEHFYKEVKIPAGKSSISAKVNITNLKLDSNIPNRGRVNSILFDKAKEVAANSLNIKPEILRKIKDKKDLAFQLINDFKANLPDEEDPSASSEKVFHDLSQSLLFNEKDICTVVTRFNYYLGGAHPSRKTIFTVIDLGRGEVIDLDTFIELKDKTRLLPIAEKYFKRAIRLEAGKSYKEAGLLENTFNLNDNFFVSKNAIGFYYNPYEIAPYAMGDISFVIPIRALKDEIKGGRIISLLENL
ncbi:MAG: DUF3298 domain-containing protein [Leptospiraceae bacterium]|nr:DUF3298 domain-containing protein [Leptospiraceae bacterium]